MEKIRKKIRYLIPVIILALMGILVWFMFIRKTDKIGYLTHAVAKGNIEQRVNATGEVAAVQLVTVGAQVSGQIRKLHVQLGQEVKRGDMVAEIDSTTQENELAINKAKLETYAAQLAAKKISLEIAQTQYNREAGLRKKDATSRENLENAKNALALVTAEVKELESLVTQTQIAVNTSETNLSYTRITAPLDGTVVSVPVEEGQTVNANQITPTIALIADLSQMEIRLQISEGDVTRVKPGMKITYTILSEPDMVFTSELMSIDPGLTTLTDGTYTGAVETDSAIYYYGKFQVSNPERRLRIGMTTQSVISVNSAHGVLIVPTLAVKRDNGRIFVRVLEKGDKVVEREVTLGLADSMNTEIVSGLSSGERVVLAQMSETEIAQSSSQSRRPRRM